MSVAPDWPLTPLTAPLLISKLTILFQSNCFTISILGDILKAPCHSIPSLYMLKVYQYFINLLMITACFYENPSFSPVQTEVKVKSSKAAFYFSNWNCVGSTARVESSSFCSSHQTNMKNLSRLEQLLVVSEMGNKVNIAMKDNSDYVAYQYKEEKEMELLNDLLHVM